MGETRITEYLHEQIKKISPTPIISIITNWCDELDFRVWNFKLPKITFAVK
jgi:hypothetical protein